MSERERGREGEEGERENEGEGVREREGERVYLVFGKLGLTTKAYSVNNVSLSHKHIITHSDTHTLSLSSTHSISSTLLFSLSLSHCSLTLSLSSSLPLHHYFDISLSSILFSFSALSAFSNSLIVNGSSG